MKIVRVPWIQCRADEVNAVECEVEWRGRAFVVMAYSEDEARRWWNGLSETERRAMHGAVEPEREDEPSLF
jgi:hypothetical protein